METTQEAAAVKVRLPRMKRTCERDAEIHELVIAGNSPQQVGEMLGLSAGRVSQITREIDWQACLSYVLGTRGVRELQSEQLQLAYEQAMDGWRRSQRVKTAQRADTEASPGAIPGNTAQSSTTRERQVGDVRFLTQARQALADIRRLWGIEPVFSPRLRRRKSTNRACR